jgi:hypothetical protein
MAGSEQVLEIAIPTEALDETRQALLAQYPNILIGTAPLQDGQTLLWLSLWSDRPQALEEAVAALRRDRPDFKHPLPATTSLSELVARAKQAQAGQATEQADGTQS